MEGYLSMLVEDPVFWGLAPRLSFCSCPSRLFVGLLVVFLCGFLVVLLLAPCRLAIRFLVLSWLPG